MAKALEMPYGDVDIKVRQGEPWNLASRSRNQDWSGTYACNVRSEQSETSTLIATPTVTATFDGTDTLFTIVLSKADADAIPVGDYFWDMRKDTGEVLMGGRVHIRRTVTP